MASFAKLDENNVVTQIEVVNNAVIINPETNLEEEIRGIEFLRTLYKEPNANWKQTSYNTRDGIYYEQDENLINIKSSDQSKAFRIDHPGIGHTWNEELQGFISPQPYPSYTFHTEETDGDKIKYQWYAPLSPPTIKGIGDPDFINTGGETWVPYYTSWDETNQRWTAHLGQDRDTQYAWNTSTLAWDIL
jgi:hypothetical protein|tara:strand:- start:2739 stop:3308 length:570 start_codon:yes stop_codon:yes gene_type:complete